MFITGIGWVTSGGVGKGNSADPFDFKKGALPDISGNDFPVNPIFRKGRLDRFSLLGLEAIAIALKDAGLYEYNIKRHIGIVASTVFGCLVTDLDFHETVTPENNTLPDPNLFTHTLPNIFLGYAAMLFGLTGPNYILYEKESRGHGALYSAVESIQSGECDIMLAGICDVEPPDGYIYNDAFRPGAIFIMIENNPCDKQNYGKLTVDKNGNIYLNNLIIEDIESCVRECIKKA
ncbi:MAG: hypothetical protein JW927_11365 [Deltaproteobacteria bacterium]|nr:hypothetical protein [Deltaproteobacteria bacterium]